MPVIISFNKESDFTPSNVRQFENSLHQPTLVMLHSHGCGHCIQMRPEFDALKKSNKSTVVEIESSAISGLQRHVNLSGKILPKDGSMYFPMIMLLRPRSQSPLMYEGSRTKEALLNFIKANKPATSSASVSTSKPKAKSASSVKPKNKAVASASKSASAIKVKRTTSKK